MPLNILRDMIHGTLPWGRLCEAPAPSGQDRRAADDAIDALRRILDRHVDARAVDGGRPLGDDLVRSLADAGFLAMLLSREDGGLGLSEYGAFRVYETAASHSPAVSMLLAGHNSMGPSTYLPTLPQGPLRDLLARHLAEGSLSAIASTEPEGAANTDRSCLARRSADGAGHLLSGDKVFITNGSRARLLAVTATIEETGQVGLFFVEAPAPGFEVIAEHEFMGLHGAPTSHIRLTDVFVPDGHMVSAHEQWRTASPFAELHTLARVYLISAPSMASARRSLGWARDWVTTRRVDGKELASYEAVQRMIAASAADVFAADSAVRWALAWQGTQAPLWERDALKNLTSTAAWRVTDRTVSLLGAQGYESARGKAARGVPDLPAEQAQRDVRGMRIGGGVDFNLDRVLAARLLATYYRGERPERTGAPEPVAARLLSAANQEHLARVEHGVRRLADACGVLTSTLPSAELLARQETLITVNRIVTELFGQAVVLARTEHLDPADPAAPLAQDLTDVHCDAAQGRLTALWARLGRELPAAYPRVAQAWTDGESAGLLDI
ncbi:acyl-CoA dehydrogenase family protein [Streptomyces sp. NPDC047065]|uniref:acyl-CoA dehydrogenase family protein n=1 Tax=Streptomyces sp. NPDC047065 TaxID=3154606 RepID=UPI00340EC07B